MKNIEFLLANLTKEAIDFPYAWRGFKSVLKEGKRVFLKNNLGNLEIVGNIQYV